MVDVLMILETAKNKLGSTSDVLSVLYGQAGKDVRHINGKNINS
ncbi:MAG: hypothetical protein ACQZ3M_09485 [cyanobacterium endosymbiont of Rhopalodia fuxianensis]